METGTLYSIKRLYRIASEGLGDMWPAARQAFNSDPTDDRLDEVFGSAPRLKILAGSLLAIGVGEAFARLGPALPADAHQYVSWPAVAVGILFAALVRRYLFAKGSGRAPVEPQDFPWLAASLAVPLVLLVALSLTSDLVTAVGDSGESSGTLFGQLVLAITNGLGVAAAVTIAVAALCFSKDWVRGLINLAVRLLVFRIMVFVTTLVVLDVGIVAPVVAGVLGGIFQIQIPDWVGELIDQLSYGALMSVIYLAVIGGTWTVCQRSFAELLRTGDVDILKTIEALAKSPKKKKAKKDKKKKQ